MRMNSDFYVYRWIRLDTRLPFYVGKGKGNRFQETKKGRNKYFRHVIKAVPTEVEIILDNLTEAEAFAKEIEFIKMYKDLGYCETNFSDGGEGPSGFKHSEETKTILSEKSKQNNPRYWLGKKRSPETIQKISEAKKGQPYRNKGKPTNVIPANSRQILCLNNNRIYDSAYQAARELKCQQQNICKVCKGKRSHTKGFQFQYYIENKEAA